MKRLTKLSVLFLVGTVFCGASAAPVTYNQIQDKRNALIQSKSAQIQAAGNMAQSSAKAQFSEAGQEAQSAQPIRWRPYHPTQDRIEKLQQANIANSADAPKNQESPPNTEDVEMSGFEWSNLDSAG